MARKKEGRPIVPARFARGGFVFQTRLACDVSPEPRFMSLPVACPSARPSSGAAAISAKRPFLCDLANRREPAVLQPCCRLARDVHDIDCEIEKPSDQECEHITPQHRFLAELEANWNASRGCLQHFEVYPRCVVDFPGFPTVSPPVCRDPVAHRSQSACCTLSPRGHVTGLSPLSQPCSSALQPEAVTLSGYRT